MKRQANLLEPILALDNLILAFRKASHGKRHRPAVARFEFHLESELIALQDDIRQRRYRPGAFFAFRVHDPKPRDIHAAPFRDRVLHHAICQIIEPALERRAIFDSYACRPGKGTHAAIQRAQQFARRHRYFAKADVRRFFPSIHHAVLKALLARVFKDRALLDLLGCIIDHAPSGAAPGRGLPIGNLTSQHFANLYLGELDHHLKDRLAVPGYLRYMDDMLLFADDKPTLHRQLAALRAFLDEPLRLQLKESATVVAPVSEGIPFLGLRIFPRLLRLQRRTLNRCRRRLRARERAYRAGRLELPALTASVASIHAHLRGADTRHLRQRLLDDSPVLV